MNKVTVDLEAGTAIIGAGTLVQEAIDAAHEAKAHIGMQTISPPILHDQS